MSEDRDAAVTPTSPSLRGVAVQVGGPAAVGGRVLSPTAMVEGGGPAEVRLP